jgi:hypothetical protein
MPRNKGLGILAIVFDCIAFLTDFGLFIMGFIEEHGDLGNPILVFVGIACIIDVVMLCIVINIFKKNKEKFN